MTDSFFFDGDFEAFCARIEAAHDLYFEAHSGDHMHLLLDAARFYRATLQEILRCCPWSSTDAWERVFVITQEDLSRILNDLMEHDLQIDPKLMPPAPAVQDDWE